MEYKAITFFVVSFTFGLLLFVPTVRASTDEIQAKEDASVNSSYPDTNYGNNGTLAIGVIVSDIFFSYIQFDISDLILQDIESISLRLRVSHIYYSFGNIKLSLVESNWIEEIITYNSQPSKIELASQSFSSFSFSDGDFKSFSLKKNYLNFGNLISFKLEYTGDVFTFYSKEGGASNAPTLVIKYPEPLVSLENIPIVTSAALLGTVWTVWIVLPAIKHKLKKNSR